MNIYTLIASKLLFPLHEKLKKHETVSVFKEHEKSQWLSTEEIMQNQLVRLQFFLEEINKNVPYYKKLFADINFDPNRVNGIEDLSKLPFLTKEVIRKNSEQLKSNTANDLSKFNTGGSSGQPLVFYLGSERVSHDVAAKWRATRWWDVDIGDRELVIWGSPIELGSQDKVRIIRDKLFRTKLISAFELTDKKIEGFIREITSYKPKMLFGYPSAISKIAIYANQHGFDMKQCGVKVVFVTSERLYPEQRAEIESCFNCKVANGYGGRDAGFIAHECPEGNMHITAEDIIVETIDSEGNHVTEGTAGEIVVTHLATKGYPFVRYRTGDIGVLDNTPCNCGRGLPILKEIQGRTTDFVVSQDGTIMHGLALIYILREIASISEFKIVQETKLLTKVFLIVDSDFSDHDKKNIVGGFKKRLGSDVEIDINMVDVIPAEKSGKFRYVISHAVDS